MTQLWLDEILRHGTELRELEPGLFSTIPRGERGAAYDPRAPLYDAIVGRSLYHRLFWGTSPRTFTDFARAAIDAAGRQRFAEAGCGSLLFTHRLHRRPTGPPTLLMDRSLRMLQRGAARLRAGAPDPPRRVVLLHADVGAVPLRPGTFRAILSLNMLHVPCDAMGIARQLGRLLEPGRGRLFVSCLVRSGRWSDRYLGLLHRLGELRRPWTRADLERTVAADWGVLESRRVEGNMCYLVIRRHGAHADPRPADAG